MLQETYVCRYISKIYVSTILVEIPLYKKNIKKNETSDIIRTKL